LRGLAGLQHKNTHHCFLTTEASDTLKMQGKAAGATGWDG